MSEKTPPEEEAPEDAEAEEEDEDGEEDEDEDEDGESQKGGKGKLIAIIAIAVVLLLGGGGGGAWYFGLFDSTLGSSSGRKKATLDLGVPARYEMPMIKADLKTGACKSALVRTLIVVELGSKDLERIEAMQPRITDAITTYLRDYERQDMVGRKGSDKFRADTTRIINNLIAPSRIQSLIFKEFIVQ